MRAGVLRDWLTFWTPGTELDSDGNQVDAWVEAFATNPRMPCEVVALSGKELLAAQAVQSKVSVRIRVRWRPGFEARMRATDEETVYSIEAVIPDNVSGRRYVTLLASTGVNEG